jgi:3D (Asp-Asp-Asp) domain-containing protein
MRNLVRGGIIPVIFSLCVVIIFAQTRPAKVLSIAKDSQVKTETVNTPTENTKDQESANNTTLVKTTGMVRAARAVGASRGSFTATAYCLKGRTAMGGGVRRGIIAADPNILRLGSTIFLGAGSYTGEYTVADTGGSVRGRRIDIWVPTCAEARRFGRRTVTINAVEK